MMTSLMKQPLTRRKKNNRPGIILELLGLVAAEGLICRLEIFRGW